MTAGRKNTNTKTDWDTPPKYIKVINEFFGKIDLDPCSNETSMVDATIKYILPTDGLKESWDYKKIFVNPPFGRNLEEKTSVYTWLKKGVDANQNGSELLYLIPVSTNISHFKELIFVYGCGICFLKDTRLRFWNNGIEDKKGAPMACCMVYFGNDYDRFDNCFSEYGKCFKI